jgi:glycosyltransferase involved in cell wall biosynthesis
MRSRRLLVVTYHWPPFTGAGAARWSSMVRHLRLLGHEVTVLTTSLWDPPTGAAAEGVVRTRDLAAAGTLRRLLRRPAADAAAPAADEPSGGLRSRLLVPDPYVVSWAPFAASAARRLIRSRRIDCVITSSPPDSVHLAGLWLGGLRPPWIAELRDGWTYEPLRPPFATAWQRRLDARLERRVALTADGLAAATEPLAADLEHRFGRPAATIGNAWDPLLEPEIAAAEPTALEADRVSLVYTGSLGGIRGHDDRGLLAALREISRDDPDLAGGLRLVIAGPLTAAERGELASPDLAPVVRTVGELSHAEALRLQRQADALLLVTSRDASIATGKLFEYLAAGKPIVALAGENEAAATVAATRTGRVVEPDDVPGIRRALADVASGDLEREYEPRDLDRHVYPAPAIALSELIDRVLSSRPCAG